MTLFMQNIRKMLTKEKIQLLIEKAPILRDVIDLQPLIWLNEHRKKMEEMPIFELGRADMDEVVAFWERFAPFLSEVFPETASANGKISSPLKEIPKMKLLLEEKGAEIPGRLFIKCDSDLAVAGSIKARGGFYEVLHYAEKLALEAGYINEGDDYRKFASSQFRELFSKYRIGVGSTGNLAISIGIMSARLGFHVSVFMSGDAKEWKKKLLRAEGVEVVEFEGDFSEAMYEGRKRTLADKNGYFVDDENSHHLFKGYSIGALELQQDLERRGIVVDEAHPLFVYSPCGVGGSSGGIAFGLKQIYGDAVHSFFVEPTHSPAVLVGLASGEMSNISVQDIGIDNITEADGLAVGRSSKFATEISSSIIGGVYTIEDNRLYELLADLWDTEKIFVEPSSTAGLIGPQVLATTDYAEKNSIDMAKVVHVAWATGGARVPQVDRDHFYQRGRVSVK